MVDPLEPTMPSPGSDSFDNLSRARVKARLRTAMFGHEPSPVKLGRFVIVEQLGRGGMGIVYTCYDPKLRREVAVKLLRTSGGSEDDDRGRERLLREAQAMAGLSHPNVVPVFEVGDQDGRVFIAMERVVGSTLRDWVGAERRAWGTVVEVYLQAARGLAAAHAAGIVHRDFKPENALIGEDGRVRVMDFGLARDGADAELERTQHPGEGTAPAGPLTQTGTVLGTPAYMSPEQHRGERADAKSDQFAWCVALWEALFGERPFAGRTVAELRESVLSGEIRSPKRAGVPERIRAALAQGLAADPAMRHRSLGALGEQLQRRRATGVLWRWVAGGAIVVALGAVALRNNSEAPDQPSPCSEPHEILGPASDVTLDGLAPGIAAVVHDPWVAASFESIVARMRRWVSDWRESYDSACRAATSSETENRTHALLKIECLEQHAVGVRDGIPFLRKLDSNGLREFAARYSGHDGGPDIAACDNKTFLRRRAQLPSDSAVRQLLLELKGELGRGHALVISGQPRLGLEIMASARAKLEQLGQDAFLADALVSEAMIKRDMNLATSDEIGQLATRGLALAESSGNDAGAADALAFLAAEAIRNGEPWESLFKRATAAAKRAGSPFSTQARLANFLAIKAILLSDAGGLVEARHAQLQLYEARYCEDCPSIAPFLVLLASALSEQGRGEDAIRVLRRRNQLIAAEVGEAHPAVASGLLHIAAAYEHMDDVEQADAHCSEAISFLERAFPDGGIALARAHQQCADTKEPEPSPVAPVAAEPNSTR